MSATRRREADILIRRFGSLAVFKQRTRIPVSMETCRRFFYEAMPVSTVTLIIILKYIGVTPREIREALRDGVKKGYIVKTTSEAILARDLSELIGDNNVSLTTEDKALLKIYKALRVHKEACHACAAFLAAINKAYKLGVDEDLVSLAVRGG